MRNVLLVLMAVALAIPAAAVEYEITTDGVRSVVENVPSSLADVYRVFESRTETEMSHDNGTNYWSHYGLKGQASTYTAPSDCHLATLKYYLKSSGHTYYHDCYGDSGGTPNHNDSYFSAPIEYTPSTTGWNEIDVAYEGVTFSDGEVFHPFMDDLNVAGTSDDQGIISGGSGGPEGSNWWQFTTNNWSAYHVLFGAALVRVIIDDDMDPPYVDEQDPADGGWAQPDTDIVFHCKDDDKGINVDTVGFTAEDESRGEISGSLEIDYEDINDVVCTFTPDSDLPEGDTITCTVPGTLADGLGNEMGADEVWSFGIDSTPPTITQEYPTGGRTGGYVPATRAAIGGGTGVAKATVSDGGTRTAGPDTNIGWHIEDNAAGCLFADCVYSVQVGGVDVPVAENITDDGTTDVTVDLDPVSDFNPGDVVDVSVQATDMAGNTMPEPYEWSFTVGYVSVEDASLGTIKAGYH
ncbi:MAG: hypothetical protein JSW52_05360 [Candidatus Coatesbacteria bacterium]|nr:MAG: hypothetical protein JSW52_05360 [Candidatus Coatesbacteria bacterium]